MPLRSAWHGSSRGQVILNCMIYRCVFPLTELMRTSSALTFELGLIWHFLLLPHWQCADCAQYHLTPCSTGSAFCRHFMISSVAVSTKIFVRDISGLSVWARAKRFNSSGAQAYPQNRNIRLGPSQFTDVSESYLFAQRLLQTVGILKAQIMGRTPRW
jgi:hypothetical protein